jgi:SNF2 family DNA or RNA helicase
MNLFPFQKKVLDATEGRTRVAYYLDMGLGKTFVGAEKAVQLRKPVLCVCQKSKVDDWVEHFTLNYPESTDKPWCVVFDLTRKKEFQEFLKINTDDEELDPRLWVGVINYDILYRRPELTQLLNFTLLLDESSLITNENAKRSKFILNKLHPANVVLLSGTPTNGKYELLWSQMRLLGWKISKELYWQQYIDVEYIDNQGFPVKIVKGYKNVDRLKQKMRDYGCIFLKTDEVFDLPEQIHNKIYVQAPKEYRIFQKNRLVEIEGRELVGDSVLTLALYSRQICGAYCKAKIEALKDLLESSCERFLIFYNFNAELEQIKLLCNDLGRPLSIVNGSERNLDAYENKNNSVTLVQYQAGSMGLNLQKCSRIIYFTLPWRKGSCGNFEQSKKRIHRIGQKNTCYYYYLLCKGTIEETNLAALQQGKELTDELFKE